MSTLVWFEGRIRRPDEPLVTALDRGLTVGDGVFDTCAIVGGHPFALRRHVERLLRSAAAIGLPEPPASTITDAARELATLVEGGTGRLRITWTQGPGPAGSARTEHRPTLLLTASPEIVSHPSPDGAGARNRTAVVVVPWPRNERSPLTGVKSTSYAENVLALDHARARGGTEAIFANTRGELCEGAATNVFVELDGVLLTPPLSSGCLPGVTRELVLEWAREARLPVREETIPVEHLASAEHVAVTSSLRGIVPVDAVDGRELSPGPLTLRMQEVFAAAVARDLDP